MKTAPVLIRLGAVLMKSASDFIKTAAVLMKSAPDLIKSAAVLMKTAPVSMKSVAVSMKSAPVFIKSAVDLMIQPEFSENVELQVYLKVFWGLLQEITFAVLFKRRTQCY